MALVSEFPVITDEALAELRSRIGVEVCGPDPYLTEASRDGIRHWADREEPGPEGTAAGVVECEVEATNQRGEVTAKGVAVAELPRKGR